MKAIVNFCPNCEKTVGVYYEKGLWKIKKHADLFSACSGSDKLAMSS